jgi:hypothetical protein
MLIRYSATLRCLNIEKRTNTPTKTNKKRKRKHKLRKLEVFFVEFKVWVDCFGYE